VPPKPYLYVEDLAALVPWTAEAIRTKVRRGEFPAGSKVLYAHLGGVPALNAYSFLFRNG
jgi:hypothetical protein